jgi:hypothetical protein
VCMSKFERGDPLSAALQGRWVDADDPTSELVIAGGRITCFGKPVAYDYGEVVEEDGPLTVSLMVDDPAMEDAFQRANVTGLAITPEGALHAYNVRFASKFVRPT